MIKYIKPVLEDLKNGENLDLYATILLSIIISVLGLLGSVKTEVLSATILATLALICGSTLTIRRAISDLKQETIKLDVGLVGLKKDVLSGNPDQITIVRDFPDFSDEFSSASRISILGASLNSTTIKYYSLYEQALKRGASLRILVCEPSESVSRMQVFRTYIIKDSNVLTQTINNHLTLIEQLKEKLPDAQCESRTIPLIISYGLVWIETVNGDSRLYVKLMPFRAPASQQPTFMLDNTKREWLSFFSNQFELLWAAGTSFKSDDQ